MKKILNYLNGHKTIICLGMSTILVKAIEYDLIEKTKYTDFIGWGLLALAGGALTHHVAKTIKK